MTPFFLSPLWWRYRMAEAAVAVVLVIGIIYFSTIATNQYRRSIPPNVWFAVTEVFVPDFEQGTDPDMIYDRTVRQPFSGFRVVEVQREEDDGLFSNYCQTQSIASYDVDGMSFARKVKWDWFVGAACHVGPGKYRLRVSWTIQADGWPEKMITATSNIFNVEQPHR